MTSRRVVGIETEYGITCASADGGEPPLDPEAAAQELFRPVLERTRSTNTFLDNGARLYLDVGSHPEYATAECDRLEDLLANDRAGELIFAELAEEANARLAEREIAGEIHLFRNNNDAEGNSFGCHENYLVRRRPDYRARIQTMLPFFVTRQIVVGAGHIRFDEEGAARYEFSQRAWQMDDAISAASTRSRPMINTRDEPHGDPEKYRRMHVIVGDSNIAQASTGLKIAATEALLTLVEEGGELPEFRLADPIAAIRTASADLTGRARLELAEGGTATALDIQKAFRDAALDFLDASGRAAELDPLRRDMLDLWTRAIDAVEKQEPESIATEIDWAAKLVLLRRYQERSGLDLSDPRIARLDLAYHDITAGGLRTRMEHGGLLRTIVAPEACEKARTVAPQTTRAKIRGEFVRTARLARADFVADWTNLRLLEADGPRSVVLSDPFATVDMKAEALMEEARR